jgi:uncharacterized membrane protein
MAALGMLAPFAVPVTAGAQAGQAQLKCGADLQFSSLGADGEPAACGGDTAASDVDRLVDNVINILSLVVGVVAVIMIIIGGMRYITSNGDSGQVGNAKNTILYAVIGLVVVALAQIIVRFVVNRAVTPATTEE